MKHKPNIKKWPRCSDLHYSIQWLTTVLIVFVFTSGCFAREVRTQATEVNSSLINATQARCELEKQNLLSFPGNYLLASRNAYCELAFFFDPYKYADELALFVTAKSFMGIASANDVETDFFEPFLSNDILYEDRALNSVNLEKFRDYTMRGDPLAAYMYSAARDYPEMFGLDADDPALFLSKKEIQKTFQNTNRSLNEKTLQVLFLKKADLISEFKTEANANISYIKAVFDDAHKIDAGVMETLSSRLINALIDQYGGIENPYQAAYEIPQSIVIETLALSHLAGNDGDTDWLAFPLMTRALSAREKGGIGTLGFEMAFVDAMPQNADMEMIYIVAEIQSVLAGDENSYPGFSDALLENIKLLTDQFPDLIAIYLPYQFKDEILKLASDVSHFQKKLANALVTGSISNLSGIERAFLLSDLRKVAGLGIQFDEIEIYETTVIGRANFIDQLLKSNLGPLARADYFLDAKGLFEKSHTEKLQQLEQAAQTPNICDDRTKLQCRKALADLNYSGVEDDVFGNLIVSASDGKFVPTCKLAPAYKNLHQSSMQLGVIEVWFFATCDKQQLAELIFPKETANDTSLFSFLASNAISTGSSAFQFFSTNPSMLLNGGGLIADLYQYKFDEQLMPLPIVDQSISVLSNASAETFFRSFANKKNQMMTGESAGFTSLPTTEATVLAKFGQYEKALLILLNELERLEKQSLDFVEFGAPNWSRTLTALVRAKHLMRQILLPEKLISELVDEQLERLNPILSNLATSDQDSTVPEVKVTDKVGVMLAFLNNDGTSAEHIPSTFFSNEKPELNFIKKALSSQSSNYGDFCLSDDAIKQFSSLAVDPQSIDLLLKYSGDHVISSNIQRLYSRCLSTWVTEQSLGNRLIDPNKITDDFFASLPSAIDSGQNFADPRHISLVVSLSDLSRHSNNPFGIAASLIALKYIYVDLVDHFVERDSAALRSIQSDFERVLVNATVFLETYEPKNDHQKTTTRLISNQLKLLFASTKHTVLATQTRKRLLGGSGDDDLTDPEVLATFEDGFKELLESLQTAQKRVAESNGALDYIKNKALMGNHDFNMTPQPFLAPAITSYLEAEGALSGFNILTLNAGANVITASLLGFAETEMKFSAEINKRDLANLKKEIQSSNSVSTSTAQKACELFKPFYSQLPDLKSQQLSVLPSVNLFPIPVELILGSYCTESETSYVLVSSLHAALDYRAFISDSAKPTHLVGVGNPVESADSFEIAIFDENSIRGGKINFQLSLPPLPSASEEIVELTKSFDTSETFLEESASVLGALNSAQVESSSKEVAIVIATHGLASDEEYDLYAPSLLSKETELELIPSYRVEEFSLPNSVVILSACDTAAGFSDRPDMFFTGLTQSFANSGSKLLIASLWPVKSKASKEFSISFFNDWDKQPLSSAIAKAKTKEQLNPDNLPFVFIVP